MAQDHPVMSVIQAASVGIKTMADGTLRLTCDIEPAHAQAAFALFGSPGTPIAIAALKSGFAAVQEPSEKPKGGPLAKLAGMWCANGEFQRWLADHHPYIWEVRSREKEATDEEQIARLVVIDLCGVNSRAELDHSPEAEEKFQRLVRGPYMKAQFG